MNHSRCRPLPSSVRGRITSLLAGVVIVFVGSLAGSLGGSLGGSMAAHAAEPITGLHTQVNIKAREQPVAKFIREMAGQLGVPVLIDDGVRGAVNGDFDKAASEVLEDVRRAFQLTYYYDGVVLHVYPANRLNRKVLYLSQGEGESVLANARALGLTDEENRLRRERMGLVATGTPRFLEQVREISDSVQAHRASSEAPEAFRVFKLRYGWADDVTLVFGGQKTVIPGVATLLRELVGASGVSGQSSITRDSLGVTRPSLKGEGLQSVGTLSSPDGSKGNPEEVQPTPVLAASTSARPGQIKIVSDPLNNAIVIRDRLDRMANYERLIETLDVEPLMVEIEATIIDMNTDRLRQLGVEWRLESGDVDALVGELGVSPPTPIGAGGGVASLILGDRTRFLARVRALEQQGAARIVSKPHVITLANVEALLDSTSTFFVRVAGQEEVDLFDVSVGTSLRVTPHVYENRGTDQIKLRVSVEDGSASDRRVDEIPVIARSTINTQALVDEGESLLIGGLVREATSNSTNKVPLLGNLPGIGGLFRSNAKSTSQTERLFLITPRLAKRSSDGELRLDAPILSGDEGEIVRTAPVRLEPVRAALALRDEEFPLDPPLPAGTSVPTLDLAGHQAIQLERVTPTPAPSRFPAPAEPLRDTQTINVTRVSAKPEQQPVGDDWSAVPGSQPIRE